MIWFTACCWIKVLRGIEIFRNSVDNDPSVKSILNVSVLGEEKGVSKNKYEAYNNLYSMYSNLYSIYIWYKMW